MEQSHKMPCGIGLLAHVDAGKTTLSEALLYESGARRTFGRVDHGDTCLDTHVLEREKGITIFSKQAMLETAHRRFTLVDTPGHVDFSAETERTLPILDCAVLIISGCVRRCMPQDTVHSRYGILYTTAEKDFDAAMDFLQQAYDKVQAK